MAETVTAAPPIITTDSGSCQGKPRKASSRNLSRRLLRPLRRRPWRGKQSLPTVQQSYGVQRQDTANLEETTSKPNLPEAVDGRNELHPSEPPSVQVADQPTAGSDEGASTDVEMRDPAVSTSKDTIDGVEQTTDADARGREERERSATLKAPSFTSSINNRRKKPQKVPRRTRTALRHASIRLISSVSFSPRKNGPEAAPITVSSATQLVTGVSSTEIPQTRHGEEGNEGERPAISKSLTVPAIGNERIAEPNKIQRAKTWASGTIRTAIPRFKRRDFWRGEGIVTASAGRPTFPGSEDEHPQPTQPEKKGAPITLLRDTQGNRHRQKSAGVKDAERTVTESEENEQLRLGLSGSQITQKDIPLTLQPNVKDNRWKLVNAKDTEHSRTESEEIERLRRDLAESRSQVAELQKRCEAQSKDLEGSNNSFNAADKSSDSDIIRACQRLNAELQQNTTYMVDCLVENLEFQNVATNSTKERASAVHRVSGHIGQILAESLATPDTQESIPMLLQIAFQAYLASVLSTAASSWTSEPGYNAFIYGIYQRLRSVEAQAISGRWRTLARVHIIHSWSTHPETFVSGILTDLSDILVAAGCTASQSDIFLTVTSKFGQRISSLVELAGRLAKTFDDVISSDFEVFIAQPGEKFEDQMMEDTDGDQVGVKEKTVLCATHLGLVKRMPMGTSLWEKGKKQKITVLKAKVLLQSFLDG